MSSCPSSVIVACLFLALVGTASVDAAPNGYVEGRLKIVSGKPVQLDDEDTAPKTPTIAAGNYADYPLIVLTQRERKKVTRIIADKGGNYRVELAPGDYILDVEGRVTRRLHVRAQPFKIV